MRCPCGCGGKVRFGKGGAAHAFQTMSEKLHFIDQIMSEEADDAEVLKVLGGFRGRGRSIAADLRDHMHGEAKPQLHPDLMTLHKQIQSWDSDWFATFRR